MTSQDNTQIIKGNNVLKNKNFWLTFIATLLITSLIIIISPIKINFLNYGFIILFSFILAYSSKRNSLKTIKMSLLSIVIFVILIFLTWGISDINDFILFWIPSILFQSTIIITTAYLLGLIIRKLFRNKTTQESFQKPESINNDPRNYFSQIPGNWKSYLLNFGYFWILTILASTLLRFGGDPHSFIDFIIKYGGIQRLLFSPVSFFIAFIIVIAIHFSFLKGIIAGIIPISLYLFFILLFASGEGQGYAILSIGYFIFLAMITSGIGVLCRSLYHIKRPELKKFLFILPFTILFLISLWYIQGLYNPTEFYCKTITDSSDCYYELALENKNLGFCNNLGSSDWITKCKNEVGKLLQNIPRQ